MATPTAGLAAGLGSAGGRSVELTGGAELAAGLRAIGDIRELNAAGPLAARVVTDNARSLVPSKSGVLAGTISTTLQEEGRSVQIGYRSPYARWFHVPYLSEGGVTYAKKVSSKGRSYGQRIPYNPWLITAIFNKQQEIFDIYFDAVDDLVHRAFAQVPEVLMAANTTAAYAIGVTVNADTTGFVTGVSAAETAVEQLATTTETASTDIDTALVTDVPASADSSAVALTTKASKFKAVGTELGTNLVGGLSSGMSGPEAAANTANSLTGLLAATASTAGGAVAAVGIGLGIAVVTAIAKGMNQQKEAVDAAAQEVFDALEFTAETSLKDVRDAINETFTLQNAVTDLGGGEYATGLQKVQDVAADIGIEWEDILDLLRRGIVPKTQDTYDALVKAREEGTLLHGAFFNSRLQMDGTAKGADDLVGAIQVADEGIKRVNAAAADTVGYYDDIHAKASLAADMLQSMAGYANSAADASERQLAALANMNARNGTGDDAA